MVYVVSGDAEGVTIHVAIVLMSGMRARACQGKNVMAFLLGVASNMGLCGASA